MQGKNNLFVVFEGLDGSGKSTQAQLLSQKLAQQNIPVYSTFEPTKDRIGSIIRDAFVGKIDLDVSVIAGLFVADRLQHITEPEMGLLAQLAVGSHVVCDRYYLSSFAYQGAHLSLDWVMKANDLARNLLKPDITFYIDISPELAMHRINSNRESIELYETMENLEKVAATYIEAINLISDSEKIVIINGNQNVDAIANEIWTHFNTHH